MTPQLRHDFFRAEELARLERVGEVVVSPDATDHHADGVAAALAHAEVLVTGWGTDRIDADVLDTAPELRAIVHTAGSVRSMIDPVVFDRGIRVSSQTAANAEPVAEYTVGMIILASKHVFRAVNVYADLRADVDRAGLFSTAGLFGRRVGLIGLSRISRRVIELLQPFAIDLMVHSSYLGDAEAAALGVRSVSLDELLATSEVVSLHSASLPRTQHLLGARELALMPDGATFINTARGAIVDQDALIAELASGRLEAVLDVTDPDVTVPDSPLWDMKNVILTPHFAGSVGHELFRLGQAAVIDVEQFFLGGPMAGEISREQYDSQA